LYVSLQPLARIQRQNKLIETTMITAYHMGISCSRALLQKRSSVAAALAGWLAGWLLLLLLLLLPQAATASAACCGHGESMLRGVFVISDSRCLSVKGRVED